MRLKPEKIGVISAVSPLPGLLCTSFWGLLWMGFMLETLGYDQVPQWGLIIVLLPLLISPAVGVFGVVYGLVRRQEKGSVKGILLSALGLLENVALLYGAAYIGSRY